MLIAVSCAVSDLGNCGARHGMSITRTEKIIAVTYSTPVFQARRQLRVFPTELRGTQRISQMQWRCFPPADASLETTDEFGNRVLELRHACIEREFRFKMTLKTARDGSQTARETNVPPTGIGAFLLPSALCDFGAPIQNALRKIDVDNDVVRDAEQICEWAHRSIEYSIGATNLATTASQSLLRGYGVCQDYAHIMIALCRASHIPARYVSGYNAGEGAMHAWVETLCGDRWLAFDPTHNRATQDDCVFVACGRDYRDVAPTRGTFQGKARAQLTTFCQTTVE